MPHVIFLLKNIQNIKIFKIFKKKYLKKKLKFFF